jgi:cobalt/nickel transport system ATP-binding protein
VIKTVDLWFSYGRDPVLKGVDFRAERGEVTILLGRNGAGKSTLLMHLNGLLRPLKGEIYIDGMRVSHDKRSLMELRRKVGYVFQNPDDQIIAPTVWQDVAFGPKNLGLKNEDINRAVSEALKAVGLEGYENRLCNKLSGGEKKRVSIAGVLAMQPEYIIMDEPTAGLDGIGLKNMVELVEKLREDGRSLIISTHDLDFAVDVGDRFVILSEGRIAYEGGEIDYNLAEEYGIRLGAFGNTGELVVIPHTCPIPEIQADFVAVMGRNARKRLEEEGIEADILTASLERSILRAISGSTVLLVCSQEMLDVVRREAQNFPLKLSILDGSGTGDIETNTAETVRPTHNNQGGGGKC